MRSVPSARRSRRSGSSAMNGRPAVSDWTAGAGVFVPQGYEPGYAYPLLVWFSDGVAGFDLGRAMSRLSLRNFVAVQPARDGAAVWRAIDRVRDRLSIHPRRIWAIGAAAGGTAAFRAACRDPDLFAGAVSLGGWFPLDEPVLGRLAEVRGLKMLLSCRAAAVASDPRPLDRTLRLFHAAGACLAVRIYQRGGELSRSVLGDANRWLMDELGGTTAALQPGGAV